MKKTIALLLAVFMLFSLMTACTKNNESGSPEAEPVLAPESTETAEQSPEEELTEEDTKQEEITVEEDTASPESAELETEEKEPEEETVAEETVPETVQPEKEQETPEEVPEEDTAVKEESSAPEIPSETPILPPAGETVPEETPEETPPVKKELSAIIDEIYGINDPILPVGTIPVDLNDPYSLSAFTGLSDAAQISEAIASESMMGAQAYSLVLVRLKDSSNAQTVAQAMRNGIDQRKWICVNADDIRVVAADDVVMLCMIASNLDVKVNDMVSAFSTVMGSTLTADIS